jgi:hypothetical protein
MVTRFNIRVYGIWIEDGQLLINEELIRGRRVIKLPGGGLDAKVPCGRNGCSGLRRAAAAASASKQGKEQARDRHPVSVRALHEPSIAPATNARVASLSGRV